MAKYFKKISSFEDLKNKYRALLKENHPDNGGKVETMQEINVEFDALFSIWKDRHEAETSETVTETAQETRRHFYTDFGWAGDNYDRRLTLKEIAQIVRAYVKEKYPTCKFSVRTHYASMCQELTVSIKEFPAQMYKTADDLRREGLTYMATYTDERTGKNYQLKNYKDEIDANMRKLRANNYFYLDQWDDDDYISAYAEAVEVSKFYAIKTDYFNSVLEDVDAFIQSYNYEDCDGMQDYFDVNFYYFGCSYQDCKQVEKQARVTKQDKPPVKAQKAAQTDEATASEENTVEAKTEPETTENAPEIAPQETPESNAAPDMFAELAKAYATGATYKPNKGTTTPKKEEPKAEAPEELPFCEVEHGGKVYTVTAAKEPGHIIGSYLFTVTITDADGQTVKQEQTTTPAEAQRIFTEYCEKWKPEKAAPGYTGESSQALTADEIEVVTNGGQVRKESDRHAFIYIATPYNEKTALVYQMSRCLYRDEVNDPLRPGENFNYCGFITCGKYYTAKNKAIIEEFDADIETAAQTITPDEQTAEKNAGTLQEYEQEQIETLRNSDYINDARRAYFKNEAPALKLHHYYNGEKPEADIIRYIENPAEIVTEYAEAYTNTHKLDILRAYIAYNRTAEAYRAIIKNPADEAHTLKAISDSITDQKTAKITLKNGETVKAEARGIKGITYDGKLYAHYVETPDRGKLPKNERGHAEDIPAADIVAITHGAKTLYKAS